MAFGACRDERQEKKREHRKENNELIKNIRKRVESIIDFFKAFVRQKSHSNTKITHTHKNYQQTSFQFMKCSSAEFGCCK